MVGNYITLPWLTFNTPSPKEDNISTTRSPNSTSFASTTLSNGTNYLFYYDSNRNLACLSGQDAGVFSNATVQSSEGVTIQAGTHSPLAATAWKDDATQLKEVSRQPASVCNRCGQLVALHREDIPHTVSHT